MTAKKRAAAKKKRRVVTALVVAAVLLIAGGAAGFIYHILDLGADEGKEVPASFEDLLDKDDPELDNDVQVDMLRELRASSDLFSTLKTWAATNTRNSLMQSKNVINVLVVGLDASDSNSDAIMLVSVNTAEKKIFLSSVMRDSYTYMKTPQGEQAAKINAAYANGGIDCLVDVVQNDYKIKIDHYVSLNFRTFVSVVDILGGVRVPVQQYEMYAMNSLADTSAGMLYEYGDDVLLNGEQALLYCRIRKCDVDSDISRTRRQRQFISSLIDQSRNISAGDLPDLVRTVRQYVRTDMSSSALISLGTKALSGKWYKYEIISNSFPLEENRMDFSGRSWVWIVDYPADAVALQKLIYGETNIELSADRTSAVDIVRSGGF